MVRDRLREKVQRSQLRWREGVKERRTLQIGWIFERKFVERKFVERRLVEGKLIRGRLRQRKLTVGRVEREFQQRDLDERKHDKSQLVPQT
jgi:hypothetical protein